MEEVGNMFDDADTVSALLAQLAGYASMCWTENGVFESQRALFAVDQAEARLKEIQSGVQS